MNVFYFMLSKIWSELKLFNNSNYCFQASKSILLFYAIVLLVSLSWYKSLLIKSIKLLSQKRKKEGRDKKYLITIISGSGPGWQQPADFTPWSVQPTWTAKSSETETLALQDWPNWSHGLPWPHQPGGVGPLQQPSHLRPHPDLLRWPLSPHSAYYKL